MAIKSSAPRRQRLEPSKFRDVIGRFASGVTVVTTLHEGVAFGTTASALSSLSLEPPMLLICMNQASSTGRAITAAGSFAVNVLSEDQADLAMRFATKAGDKFDGIALSSAHNGVPLLAEALATLECRVVEAVTAGTHRVFIAEVERAAARSGSPLAYFRGAFGRLHLGDGLPAEVGTPRNSPEAPGVERIRSASLEMIGAYERADYPALQRIVVGLLAFCEELSATDGRPRSG